MTVNITINELKAQIALGTVDENIRESIWKIEDTEILIVLGESSEEYIRRAVAVNPHTPDEVLQGMYNNDPAPIVRDMAWEMIDKRCQEKGEYSPPRPVIELDISMFDDLPEDTQIYRS